MNLEQPPFWSKCLSILEEELSAQQLNTWVRPLRVAMEGRSLRLFAPNRFVQDWVRDRFLGRIAELARRELGEEIDISVEIGAPMATPQGTGARVVASALEPRRGLSSGGRLNPEFTFESHVEGKSNQLARAASRQVGENPGRSYNPLFIYGGVGLGKTHLMQAAGHVMMGRVPGARVIYVHSERFVADMVKALRHNTINEFKR